MNPRITRTAGMRGRAGCRSRVWSPAVMTGVALVGFAMAIARRADARSFELAADAGAAAFVVGLFAYRSGGRS
ncbi:MAG: hypothetical protein ACYCV5_11455 [Acidimicrobiales bacterium]